MESSNNLNLSESSTILHAEHQVDFEGRNDIARNESIGKECNKLRDIAKHYIQGLYYRLHTMKCLRSGRSFT